MQPAIDYLDHAPAGFFSAEPEGRIVYLNATLAEWLGIDLARFEPGTALSLHDIVRGDERGAARAAAREQSQAARAIIDLDSSSGTASLPVPASPPGARRGRRRLGATRGVLNRSPGEEASEPAAPPRCASPASSTTRPSPSPRSTGEGRIGRDQRRFPASLRAPATSGEDRPPGIAWSAGERPPRSRRRSTAALPGRA